MPRHTTNDPAKSVPENTPAQSVPLIPFEVEFDDGTFDRFQVSGWMQLFLQLDTLFPGMVGVRSISDLRVKQRNTKTGA